MYKKTAQIVKLWINDGNKTVNYWPKEIKLQF